MILWHRFDPQNREHAVWRQTPEFVGWRVPLIDSPPGPCSPNAKLIEQRPGSTIAPHFHDCHQFQVVSAGSGMLGRRAVRPLTVHYTAPHTGYGPIEAEAEGLNYYVLRARRDPGAMFLPQARAQLRTDLPKRHAVSEPAAPCSTQDLQSMTATAVHTCLPLSGEGMAAWRVNLPPGGELAAAELPGAGARFYLVATGALALQGTVLGAGSVCFAEAADAFRLQAPSAGADVLVLQFPPEATALH